MAFIPPPYSNGVNSLNKLNLPYNTPIPVGPYALCPEKAIKSISISWTSIFVWAILCAASTTNKILLLWHTLDISFISLISPITLVICAIETTFVLSVITLFKLSIVTSLLSLSGIYLTTIPISLANINHGNTFEACSVSVINTSSPLLRWCLK